MRFLGVFALLGSLAQAAPLAAIPPAAAPPAKDTSKLLHSLPLRFEQDAHGRWTSHGPGFAALFDRRATVMRVGDRVVSLSFTGSNPEARFNASDPAKTQTNYFVGKDYRSVQSFSRLQQTGTYKGIDVVYYGDGQRLEYDFNLQPGADPSAIRMRFQGADQVRVNDRGEIVLKLGTGEVVQNAPVVYQRVNSKEVVAVESRYRIAENGDIGLLLGDYDRARPVVIDPAMLYGLYLTGSNADAAVGVQVDQHGIVYLAGYTYSTDFPLGSNGYQLFPAGANRNGWIWKLNPFAPAGQALLYSTYFAGNLDVDLRSFAVDAKGVIYFGGTTLASNLPVTSNAYQSALANTNALNEGFVAAIDTTQSGTAGLIYCSYYGGSQIVTINGVATLGGRIYVTGWTNSPDLPLAGNSFQSALAGGYDAFVAEFDPGQGGTSSLVFASYLGGFLTDVGRSIAVDQFGLIYVAGSTLATDFPTTLNAFQPTNSSAGDGFLTQINPSAGTIPYSTYIGGSDTDVATNVLVDPATLNVTVAGYTYSNDFPITPNAAQPAYGGNGDAFVITLNINAQSRPAELVYSSFYGGSDTEITYGLTRDPSGRYGICGYTLSRNLPVTAGALNPASSGQNIDGFMALLDPNAALTYASYITGPGYQVASGIASDSSGNLYVAGYTTSDIFAHGPTKSDDPGNIDVFFLIVAPGAATAANRRDPIDVFYEGADKLTTNPLPRPRQAER
ncbi:MAG: SBBP repeat-containing protein [Bryobacterales bacterium]|nr:SBBP repeat-containing protein [Bryobacterales bacterium]